MKVTFTCQVENVNTYRNLSNKLSAAGAVEIRNTALCVVCRLENGDRYSFKNVAGGTWNVVFSGTGEEFYVDSKLPELLSIAVIEVEGSFGTFHGPSALTVHKAVKAATEAKYWTRVAALLTESAIISNASEDRIKQVIALLSREHVIQL